MTAAPTTDDLFGRGLEAHRAGRLAQAEAAYRHVLSIEPDHAEALRLSGVLANVGGRPDLAVDFLERAIALSGGTPDHHVYLGRVLQSVDRFEDAEAAYAEALALAPDHRAALNDLGLALQAMGKSELAEARLRDAIRASPEFPAARANLGQLLCDLDRHAEAEPLLRDALRLAPNVAETLSNLGMALTALGRLDEAEAACREAIARHPDLVAAHMNLASVLLLSGRLAEGWAEYEWRRAPHPLSAPMRRVAAPPWRGEPLAGRTLLIHAEQGLGDTIQFCRLAGHVGAQGRVVLQVYPPLVRLLRTLDGVDTVVSLGERLPTCDLECPLLSLPHWLGVPPPAPPYLFADRAASATWRGRLAGLTGLKVGLVWAGGPPPGDDAEARDRRRVLAHAAMDSRRSLLLETLAPLGDVAGVSFVSLQKGPPASQALNPPPGLALRDDTADLADFADTAALVQALDLVIGVDTSVIHLAGALGKPVWLLNRHNTDWRWMLNRDDSPWYPSLRQFRQPAPGDWQSVIAGVRNALAALAAGDQQQLSPQSPGPAIIV